jgi:hypothetical protein
MLMERRTGPDERLDVVGKGDSEERWLKLEAARAK